MSEKLFDYFAEERRLLQSELEQLQHAHQRVASVDQPLQARLYDAFALTASRIRLEHDHRFEQLSQGLLQELFPFSQAPIPSLAMVELTPAAALTQAIELPRGTLLESTCSKHAPIKFTTTSALPLQPYRIAEQMLNEHTFTLTLQATGTLNPSMAATQTFRLYIDEVPSVRELLYQALLEPTTDFSVNAQAVCSTATSQLFRPTGFEANEALLPNTHHDAPSLRLLSEYFLFREKFMSIDVCLPTAVIAASPETLTLRWDFHHDMPRDLGVRQRARVRLNVVPVINLFSKVIEPVATQAPTLRYPLTVDKRHADAYGIYDIEAVTSILPGADPLPLRHVLEYDHRPLIPGRYSHYTLEQDTSLAQPRAYLHLRLQDTGGANEGNDQLTLRALCFNTNLSPTLWQNTDDSPWQLSTATVPLQGITWVTPPTERVYPHATSSASHALVNTLTQNHRLGLTDPLTVAAFVRQQLHAANITHADAPKRLIEAIVDIQAKTVLQRSGSVLAGFGYATHIYLTLARSAFHTDSIALFKKILQASFAGEAPLNTRLEWHFEEVT